MNTRELENLGVPRGPAIRLAQEGAGTALRDGHAKRNVRRMIADVVADPAGHASDAYFGPLAEALRGAADRPVFAERNEPAGWRQWGEDLDIESVRQMADACRLPVSVRGALMPDAHVGYGLPIGGVLATENAVIPYAVGVDIACRMKLTVLDLPATAIEGQGDRLAGALERETRFGIGASFRDRHQHSVLDAETERRRRPSRCSGKPSRSTRVRSPKITGTSPSPRARWDHV